MVVQLATRVDDDQAEEFRETTKKLGLSTADALRMFVSSFNEYQGFPYQVRVRQVAEPFENEREASDFANDLSMRMIADEGGVKSGLCWLMVTRESLGWLSLCRMTKSRVLTLPWYA